MIQGGRKTPPGRERPGSVPLISAPFCVRAPHTLSCVSEFVLCESGHMSLSPESFVYVSVSLAR